MQTERRNWLVFGLRAIAIALILGGWQTAAKYSPDLAFSLGSPSSIAIELIRLITGGQLLRHFLLTAMEASVGLTCGLVLGSLAGLSFWFSRLVADAARPLLVMFGNAPVFAFGPMMIIWLGVGVTMKVALAFYFVFFFTVAQTHEGAVRVSHDLSDVFKIYGGTRIDVFRKVIVPGALDAVFSATRRSVALALLGAFVGEFFSSSSGLGYLILRAAGVYNMPRAMAAGVAFIILALSLDSMAGIVQGNKERLLQWLAVPRRLRGVQVD